MLSQNVTEIGDELHCEILNIGSKEILIPQNCCQKDYSELTLGQANGNEPISLSQYYSHFSDEFCEIVPQLYSCKTSVSNTISNSSEVCNIFTNRKVNSVEKLEGFKKKPKIWKCTYNCGKIFTQEKYMKNHILVMHENTNSVQCKICFKYLSTNARLKNHMLRHSGVDHLVCLLCADKRASDLSCIRHHLSESHGISGKHVLFHECYYEMSLKEISLMKHKTKESGIQRNKESKKCTGSFKKSANDVEELKQKIMEKSKKLNDLLTLMSKANEKVEKAIKNNIVHSMNVSWCTTLNSSDQNSNSVMLKPQKILVAENGMKLMKLPNGQIRKVSSL